LRALKEIDEIYTKEEIQKKISEIPTWFHKIQLRSDFSTPGFYAEILKQKIFDSIPKDLSGKSILDTGANQGMFSFECERRGAKEIVAFDLYDIPKMDGGIKLCKEIFDSKVQILTLDVMDVEKLGREFDIILCFGLLYALRNPFLALQKLLTICNELVIVEAEILRTDRSICYVLEQDEILKNSEITILFSPKSLKNYALDIGFKKVEFLGYSTEQKTPIVTDKPNDGSKPLTRNRGIFYLWKK